MCFSTADKPADLFALGVTTCLLLTGYMPFEDKSGSEAKRIRNVKQGKVGLSPSQWRANSEEAQSFVRGLLVKSASERLTVEQTLAHPWVSRLTHLYDIFTSV